MASRKTSTEARPSSRSTPKKDDFKRLVKNIIASQKAVSDENTSQKEMIEGVEFAHPGVTKSIVKLEKMDPVQRDEWLFQFDIAREFMSWATSEPGLGLPREKTDAVKTTKTKPANDDGVDLRPQFLRQPGASADTAADTPSDPPKRSVKDAADAAEAALSQVGRGPTKTDPKTQH